MKCVPMGKSKNRFLALHLIFLFTAWPTMAQKGGYVFTGKVVLGKKPVSDVSVVVQNTNNGTKTNDKGLFDLKVELGDTLVFSHIGMKTLKIPVSSKRRNLKISMVPEVNALDEVVLRGKSSPNPYNDIANRPKSYQSIFGKEDLESRGYGVDYIQGKTLLPAARTGGGVPEIVYALTGKIPNYTIASDGVVLRNVGSISQSARALWDVDGVIFEGFPPPIELSSIKDVFVIQGLAGTVRYGSLGKGGVVVVRTMNDSSLETPSMQKLKNTQKYKWDAMPYEARLQEPLPIGDDKFTALANYLDSDIPALRSLAYRYQEKGHLRKALQLFRKVRSIIPQDVQAHRDVAAILWENGKPLKAWNAYIHILEVHNGQFPESMANVLFHEMERLYITENLKDKVTQGFAPRSDFSPKEDGMVRIVLEWSDGDQNFVFEVVNPNGQVFETAFGPDNGTEKTVEEFFVDNSLKGEWRFNLRPEVDAGQDLVLKVTTHHDWDTQKLSSKKVKVFHFDQNQIQKYLLLKLKV